VRELYPKAAAITKVKQYWPSCTST